MRLDICFAVNRVCQFIRASINSHWAIVKCIMCYFQGITSYGLHITCNSFFTLHGFTDVDWVVTLMIASIQVITLFSLVTK
jgi:hypothetical protein